VARDEQLDSVPACMLREKVEMRGLIDKLGFRVGPADKSGVHLTALALDGGSTHSD
jgi:hypothetical protein